MLGDGEPAVDDGAVPLVVAADGEVPPLGRLQVCLEGAELLQRQVELEEARADGADHGVVAVLVQLLHRGHHILHVLRDLITKLKQPTNTKALIFCIKPTDMYVLGYKIKG